jgi:defect-in-organelle-trafficking protein DotC
MGRKGRLVVIPPVASGAGEALRLETERSATSQLGSYRLIRGARLASIAPHWRHYLLELPDGPSGIHPSLHPRSAEESGRWRVWVDRGWELGVRRADELFGLNVSNLARDYAGMMLFRRLVAERLATGPVTAESLSEMVVGEDEIVFDRKLWRLTEDGRFAVPERSGAAGRRRFAWPPGP